jgi:hypothetical protein
MTFAQCNIQLTIQEVFIQLCGKYLRLWRTYSKIKRLNPLTLKLNPSAQRCLPRFLLGILIFKGLTTQRLYKSFGVKRLIVIQLYNMNKQNAPFLNRCSALGRRL